MLLVQELRMLIEGFNTFIFLQLQINEYASTPTKLITNIVAVTSREREFFSQNNKLRIKPSCTCCVLPKHKIRYFSKFFATVKSRAWRIVNRLLFTPKANNIEVCTITLQTWIVTVTLSNTWVPTLKVDSWYQYQGLSNSSIKKIRRENRLVSKRH